MTQTSVVTEPACSQIIVRPAENTEPSHGKCLKLDLFRYSYKFDQIGDVMF